VAGSRLESNVMENNSNDLFKNNICKLRSYDRSLLAIRGAIEELELSRTKQEKSNKNKIVPKKSKNDANHRTQKLENGEKKSSQASLTWIDLNYSENMNEKNSNESEDDNENRDRDSDSEETEKETEREEEKEASANFSSFSSFTIGDGALEELYQASDPGTVMLVLTQADIFPLVQLASKKQRYEKWGIMVEKICVYMY
jgi:hypothetical protein